MSPAFVLWLLLASSLSLGKYVHVKNESSWFEAQKYCRRFFTDLAPVSSKHDITLLSKKGSPTEYIWIGLRRNSEKEWIWSGGGKVSTFLWASNQPDNLTDQEFGMIYNGAWHDLDDGPHSFFCYQVFVVMETKTWEAALEHCRGHHGDLASVASQAEMLLIRNKLVKAEADGPVWTALRFLAGAWLWVDGQPYLYKAWGEDGEPVCPANYRHCGALQAQWIKPPDHGVFEALNCEQELPFICY